MNIYLLRHGQTDENKKKVYYGAYDAELNNEGIKDAKRARKRLKNINFDKIYVSDRMRTMQTAKIALKCSKEKFIVDKRISEINFGDFERKNYEFIKNKYPKECSEWEMDWKKFTPPNGESFITFYSRVKEFMDYIKNCNCENVLLVTHGGVIRATYAYILGENLDLYWKFASKNIDLTLIKYEYKNWFIDSIEHI